MMCGLIFYDGLLGDLKKMGGNYILKVFNFEDSNSICFIS